MISVGGIIAISMVSFTAIAQIILLIRDLRREKKEKLRKEYEEKYNE